MLTAFSPQPQGQAALPDNGCVTRRAPPESAAKLARSASVDIGWVPGDAREQFSQRVGENWSQALTGHLVVLRREGMLAEERTTTPTVDA